MAISLHTLTPEPGANVRKKRLGRGHGTGRHKTSGKGMKGQRARTGHHGLPKPGFEGGQTAMARRLPKRGFNNLSRQETTIVNLVDIAARMNGIEVIDPKSLHSVGLVSAHAQRIKILGRVGSDPLPRAMVRAHGFSESAKRLLEEAGCTIEVIPDRIAAPQR